MVRSEKDDEEVRQVVNDMLGLLERSDLNWYEAVGAVELLSRVLVDGIDWEIRG